MLEQRLNTMNILIFEYFWRLIHSRDRGSTAVKVLCYKSEGQWFDPSGFSGFFIDIKSFRSHYDPGVDSASKRNEYLEHLLG